MTLTLGTVIKWTRDTPFSDLNYVRSLSNTFEIGSIEKTQSLYRPVPPKVFVFRRFSD